MIQSKLNVRTETSILGPYQTAKKGFVFKVSGYLNTLIEVVTSFASQTKYSKAKPLQTSENVSCSGMSFWRLR